MNQKKPGQKWSRLDPRWMFDAVTASLRWKLVLMTVAGASLVFSTAFFYAYGETRRILLKNIEQEAQTLTTVAAQEMETLLRMVVRIPDYQARRLEHRRYSVHELRQLQRDLLQDVPEASGTTIAFEPYRFDPKLRYFAPYLYKTAGVERSKLLEGPSYEYFASEWYRRPKELGRGVWSEPYFDEGGGNFNLVTYSAPFYRTEHGRRQFSGVVTADLSLAWLQSMMSQVHVGKMGYAVTLSREGRYITHPDPALVTKRFDAGSRNSSQLQEIAGRMMAGEKGFLRLYDRQLSNWYWIYFEPLRSMNWSVAIVIPEKELFADAYLLFYRVAAVVSAAFGLFLVLVVIMANAIIRPLNGLAGAAAEVAHGMLDTPLPVIESRDEIGVLSRAFAEMRVSLKLYIANVAEMTAARERVESELKIARSIQMSFIPGGGSPFPGRREFEAHAELLPAREVGGDLYDFFLLDETRLFVAIGDVSDKGIPAALFMAVTSSFIKAEARKGKGPAELLAGVNREICWENHSSMFVTLFCGILDLQTGVFHYSNAGHPPPVLIPQCASARALEVPRGCAIGITEHAEYAAVDFIFRPGDTLLLYTDGVTEAMSGEKELFGWQRLVDAVELEVPVAAELLVRKVLSAVREHEAGAPPSDDVALLALRYRGS